MRWILAVGAALMVSGLAEPAVKQVQSRPPVPSQLAAVVVGPPARQPGVTPREAGGYLWFEAHVGARLRERLPRDADPDACRIANQYSPLNGFGWVGIPVAVGEPDPAGAPIDDVPRFRDVAEATQFFSAAQRYLLLGSFCGNRYFLPAPDRASILAIAKDSGLRAPSLLSGSSASPWRTLGEAIETLGQVDVDELSAHGNRRPEYVGVGVGGPGRIVGRVRDSGGGVIPGTYVDAWPRSGGGRVRATSHDDGSYDIGNLPTGWYRVIAHITGFVTNIHEYVWVDGWRPVDAVLPVAGMCDCIVSSATDKAALEVRVTDPFGRPWSEATVMLDESRRGVWPTSTEGRVAFGELDPGRYTVRIAAAGFDVTTRIVQLKARSTERLNVALQPSGQEPLKVLNLATTRRFRVETNLGEMSLDFADAESDTIRGFVTDVGAGVFDGWILGSRDDQAMLLNHQRHFGRTWTWDVESNVISFATTAAPADRIVGRIVGGMDVATNIRRQQLPEPPSYARRVAILAISASR